MSFEDRFDSRQTIIDFDDFSGQGFEPRVEAVKPGFKPILKMCETVFDSCESVVDVHESIVDAGEPAIDIREAIVHTREPGHGRIVLQHARNNIQNHGKNREANGEIKLCIGHPHTSAAKSTSSPEYLKSTPSARKRDKSGSPPQPHTG
jgi:hypothetical protein